MGGTSRNERTGEATSFRRENNVYRLTAKLDNAKGASDFARQG